MLNGCWTKQLDQQESGTTALHNGGGEPREQLAAGDGDRDSPDVASLFEKAARRGLVDNSNEVEVRQCGENSPLFSATTFEALNLKKQLLSGVYSCGFTFPSKIQAVALPALMTDPPQNLIAQSQSGTGKTATFSLALLNRIDLTKNYPQVLCLSPTYELAIQTGEVVARMGQYLKGMQIRYAVRGEYVEMNSKLTEHIVIGTPGKVLDWAYRYKLFDLKVITTFVLDEADIMVSTQGHQDQTYRIHAMLPSACQMLFFSATYGDDVMEFANQIVPAALVIRLKREDETLDNIKQCYAYCQSDTDKYHALVNVYGGISIGQAVIFCHTRKSASWLEKKMKADGHAVALLSGELTIEERMIVMDMFRAAKYKALISTNVLSRGIDVEQTTLVINWDLPLEYDKSANCETYLHRIGRAGRFGKRGVAVNLVDGEQSFAVMRQIELHFGRAIKLINVDNPEEIEALMF